MKPNRRRNEPRWMVALSGLFLLRVLGQFCVARGRARFLPPMEQWQSGLLPYPALLASQIVMLATHAAVDLATIQQRLAPRPRLSRVLGAVSAVYFLSMIARYVVSMRRHPERRWFGKTIPIAFHGVLAAHLALLARVLGRSRA